MDFSKLYCPTHRSELIINFCLKQQCRIGLCATCVCIHTNMHLQRGTAPAYENIRATFQRLTERVQARVGEFQDLQERIGQVQVKVKAKKERMREILRQARQESIELVNRFYQDKEKQLLRQMECSDKKYGLHCLTRLSKLKQIITTETQTLNSAIRGVNSYNFLEVLPRFQMQELYNSHEVLSRVFVETKDNQMYSTCINYDKSVLNFLESALSRAITIQMGFGLPNALTNQSQKVPVALNRLPGPKTSQIVSEQPKLFTLRRPSSQASISTVQFQPKAVDDKKKQQKYTNVFEDCLKNSHADESRLTLIKKGGEVLSDLESPSEEDSCESTSGFNKQQPIQLEKQARGARETILNELPNNYYFTFGSQVSEYNPFSKTHQKSPDSGSISRVSQKWKSKYEKLLNPASVSDFQGKRFSNNIKKMEQKSNNKIENSFVTSFDQDKDSENNGGQGHFMYRTQYF